MRGLIFTSLLVLFALGGCDAPLPPGKLYDVGGFKLHLLCSGAQQAGAPTVIIEAGAGVPAIGYHWLQHGLESSVRVCSYDRAGMGWSEKSGAPHDAATIARQLHALLQAAQVRPPYVLVGHSIGGLFETVYAGTYPDDVAGLVYLDPSHPQQFQRMPGIEPLQRKGQQMNRLVGIYAALGLMHVYDFTSSPQMASILTPQIAAQMDKLSAQSKQHFTTVAELDAFPDSAREAAAVTDLGDRPLVVVSATASMQEAKAMGVDDATARSWQRIIWQMHEEIAHMSTAGRHVAAEGATHMSLVLVSSDAARAAAEILGVVREVSARP